MSGKDQSVVSREALASTKPGKKILKQGLFKSRGYRMYTRYKEETEREYKGFVDRFASDLLRSIRLDPEPGDTQREFASEIGAAWIVLPKPEIEKTTARLNEEGAIENRVYRILDSNFVKMTFPVLNALYDAAAGHAGRDDPQMRRDMVEGHILAIDLSEPMDRIADRDEDLEYLNDYVFMCPYILKLARDRISRGGLHVMEAFEAGFREALDGQRLDVELKSRPMSATEEEMNRCYKKYRAVMGTAGRNMALAENPLGEIFCLGMARAAEGVGCGNEIEDSLKGRAIKVPSWPLYYSLLCGDVRRGFALTLEKSSLYLQDARLALELLPGGFSHREFLEFLFLTVDHYNQYWHGMLEKASIWSELESSMPR